MQIYHCQIFFKRRHPGTGSAQLPGESSPGPLAKVGCFGGKLGPDPANMFFFSGPLFCVEKANDKGPPDPPSKVCASHPLFPKLHIQYFVK